MKSALTALAGLATTTAYQWQQCGGGRTRANVWPPDALPNVRCPPKRFANSTSCTLCALVTPCPAPPPTPHARAQNVDYAAKTVLNPTGYLSPGTTLVPASAAQPYDLYRATPLQYVERLDEDAIFTKTPSPRVLSGGIVISALPNGRVLGLVNPDTQASSTAWSKLASPLFDAPGGMDDAADSIALDCVVDSADNFYLVTMNRNNLTNNGRVYGASVSAAQGGASASATPLTWGGAAALPWLNLHSNMRFLELFQTSVTLTAAADGQQYLVVPVASLLDLNGVAFVPAGGAAQQSCSPQGQPVSQGSPITPCTDSNCCMRTASMGVDLFGTFTGSAYVDGQGALGLIAYGAFKKDAAAMLYDASSGTRTATSASVQFIAATDQSDPFVNPWNQRVYWLGWSGSAKTGDAGVLMYCVLAAGGLSVCPGYKPTDAQGLGGGNVVDFSPMWPNSACVCGMGAPLPGPSPPPPKWPHPPPPHTPLPHTPAAQHLL